MESLRGAYQLLHFDPHISDDDRDDDGDVDEDLNVDDDSDDDVDEYWLNDGYKSQKNRFCDETFFQSLFLI